ncbi:hypothetical protein NPIL_80891 [Nephila pilipes]|uniref:Uncharacterized protein n=1 Tax=Nephila pilipes TaxID=299642 RepID=A0A8X6JXC4_NEPPI|nr:hypothetical protein NPIL_80891 [Nephila pilipes]
MCNGCYKTLEEFLGGDYGPGEEMMTMGFKDAQVPDFCCFTSEPRDVFRVELWVYLSSVTIVDAFCGTICVRRHATLMGFSSKF